MQRVRETKILIERTKILIEKNSNDREREIYAKSEREKNWKRDVGKEE